MTSPLPPELQALGDAGLDPHKFADARYRISTLYTIVTDESERIPFRPNLAQNWLLDNWWYLNICLKARQLGFTTLLDLIALDQCLFVPNFTAAIIADTEYNAAKIFRRKVLDVYDALPEALRQAVGTVKRTESELTFTNGSELTVGLRLRSGTANFLHVSEFGKIATENPAAATEISRGAFNAVKVGQTIVVESTAEGNGGAFHELVTKAQQVRDSGRPLTRLDFRLHFFPWFQKPSNTLTEEEASVVPIDADMNRYFRSVEEQKKVTLTPGQKAWYILKMNQPGVGHEGMKQEHPSTEEEPFEVATEGAIFGKAMSKVRRLGQIGKFPHIASVPVNTFWDWGLSKTDTVFILAHQRINGIDRFPWCYEGDQYPVEHYVKVLRDTGFELWGTHYFPHDFGHRRPGVNANVTLEQMFQAAGLTNTRVIPRMDSLRNTIQLARGVLPLCAFDEEDAARIVTCLDAYTWQWDERLGVWRQEPRHDEYSHGVSAYLQFALVHDELRSLGPTQKPKESRKRDDFWGKRRRRPSAMTV